MSSPPSRIGFMVRGDPLFAVPHRQLPEDIKASANILPSLVRSSPVRHVGQRNLSQDPNFSFADASLIERAVRSSSVRQVGHKSFSQFVSILITSFSCFLLNYLTSVVPMSMGRNPLEDFGDKEKRRLIRRSIAPECTRHQEYQGKDHLLSPFLLLAQL